MKSFLLLAACAAFIALPPASASAAPTKSPKKSPFAVADTDNDGRISPREYTTATKGQLDAAAAKAKFAELDKNKDGALSKAEFANGSGRKAPARKPKKEMTDN